MASLGGGVLMERWIRDYQNEHPHAAQWARGSATVCHRVETKSRIYRMAEQLRVRQDWISDEPFFAMLRAMDEVVDSETREAGRPFAGSAAAAALLGYKILFGTLVPLRDHGWPEGFTQIQDSEAELARIGLQAKGFDPIVIDGIDPAAYLWGLFEMHERPAACAVVTRLGQHAVAQPRCLAVVPQEPVRQPIPQAWSPSRELVGIGS